jgi:hypothetical protein
VASMIAKFMGPPCTLYQTALSAYRLPAGEPTIPYFPISAFVAQ